MDSKKCTKCLEIKPLTEFYVRNDRPGTRIARCRACKLKETKAWGAGETGREFYRLRSSTRREKMTVEERKALDRRDYLRQCEKKGFLAKKAKRCKVYRKAKPEKFREYRANRRARLAQATPKWADLAAIRRIYELAEQESIMTGHKVEVDHIVPLKHPLVCGMHVAYNLSPVGAGFNNRKGNRTWPNMP